MPIGKRVELLLSIRNWMYDYSPSEAERVAGMNDIKDVRSYKRVEALIYTAVEHAGYKIGGKRIRQDVDLKNKQGKLYIRLGGTAYDAAKYPAGWYAVSEFDGDVLTVVLDEAKDRSGTIWHRDVGQISAANLSESTVNRLRRWF